MVTMDTRRRWRFFHAHAGWAEPPGRARCALELARAEREGSSRGWRVLWEPDSDAQFAYGRREGVEYECAMLYDEDGRLLASLGGVDGGPDDPYRRVVAAELMLEALREIGARAEALEAADRSEVRL